MTEGIRTPNLASIAVAASLLVNDGSGSTGVQSYENLSTQLAGTGAIASALSSMMLVNEIEVVRFGRAQLYAVNSPNGTLGMVLLDANESYRGIYERINGVWIWRSPLPADAAQVAAAMAQAAKTAAEAARNATLTALADVTYLKAQAQDAAQEAIAAAEAAANVLFFDSKAAATAGLGSIANDQVIEVLADETQDGFRTRYRKESGSLVFKVRLNPDQKIKLVGTTLLYVRPDGSDANKGITNDAAGAFATHQGAIDYVLRRIDLNGQNLVIQSDLAADTVGVYLDRPWTGSGLVYLIGNEADPHQCLIRTADKDAVLVTGGGRLWIGGFMIQTHGTYGNGISSMGGQVLTGNMHYSNCVNSQINCGLFGYFNPSVSYSAEDAAESHWHCGGPGQIDCSTITITFTGAASYSAYFAGVNKGSIGCSQVTFVNANIVSCRKFLAHFGGIIDAHGRGRNFLPGNVAGEESEGGFYIGSESDRDPLQAWVSYTPTVTTDAGANGATGVLAKYKRIGTTCFVSGKFTMSEAGAAVDFLFVALPVQSLSDTLGPVANYDGIRVPMIGSTSFGSVSMAIFSAGAWPVAGNTVQFSLTYEVAP